ncbi:hypothetical protein GCM10011348_30610 [Marinobacterium nitratireducens]|uniref:SpoVT-AbrB domain-containing protein n=2 Tax=Marinobacterium nitratireducens TaxID=518897 RepID=A0A918DW83_9GAMM|nr:hypothetical protein GCM10011348_30610 [Marinobacterium nitratireducens]
MWDNSASMRIPSAIMDAAKLHIDPIVDVREEGGRIVIEPIWEEDYKLEDLVAGITESNLHSEVDYGLEVGKEAL